MPGRYPLVIAYFLERLTFINPDGLGIFLPGFFIFFMAMLNLYNKTVRLELVPGNPPGEGARKNARNGRWPPLLKSVSNGVYEIPQEPDPESETYDNREHGPQPIKNGACGI